MVNLLKKIQKNGGKYNFFIYFFKKIYYIKIVKGKYLYGCG